MWVHMEVCGPLLAYGLGADSDRERTQQREQMRQQQRERGKQSECQWKQRQEQWQEQKRFFLIANRLEGGAVLADLVRAAG